MEAHQHFRLLSVTHLNGIDDKPVIIMGRPGAWTRHAELKSICAYDVVKVIAQQADQTAVATALNDPVVKIQIAFLKCTI